MKITIDIPFDVLKKLYEMGGRILTQDNRATGRPYLYQIREKKRIYGVEESEAEGKEYILKSDHTTSFEPDELEESEFTEDDCFLVFYKTVDDLKNAFFTEQGVNEHLKANRHHYKLDADTFVVHAFRNPEMEAVTDFLVKLYQQS